MSDGTGMREVNADLSFSQDHITKLSLSHRIGLAVRRSPAANTCETVFNHLTFGGLETPA
jgi:hypothetical protein